jgi:hypothetical protein
MPITKHMASRMFDLPDPFKPVIALNYWSNPVMDVLVEYDLKPSRIISLINIYLNLIL